MKHPTMVVLVALLLGAGVVDTAGQGLENSELEGTVRDATGAVLRDAAVTLTGTSLIGGARTVITDERGTYRFASASPGEFELAINARGFKRTLRRHIVLALDTTLTIDFVLEIATLNETMKVDARGPLIDVRTSAMVTNLDSDLLQALPVRRHPGEALALAPGIVSPTLVPGLVAAFGGTIGSNGFFVDGVDVTEPRRQALWLPLNYNWLEQVQVIGPGAGAEYGEFTGAVGNAVLRSGSNRLSGLAEYWTTHWNWIDRNGSSLAGREILSWWDTTGQAGGAVLRDRIWFFGGLEWYRRDDRPLQYHGQFRASDNTERTLVKITEALSHSARLEGHVQRNWSNRTAANAGPSIELDALSSVEQSDVSWNIRLTKPLGLRTLFAARTGGYSSDMSNGPMPPNSVAGPAPSIDLITNTLSDNAASYVRSTPAQVNSAVTVTRQIDGLGGKHQIETGAEYKWNKSISESRFPGGRRIFTQNGVPVRILEWDGDRTEAGGARTALYLQDRWVVTNQFTLNLGLRADFNRGSVPRAGTVLSTNPVSPRLGFAWAFRGGRSVLKAHAGRYFDALLTERVAFMDIPGIHPSISYGIQSSGELLELFRSAPPTARAIDPNIRHSYVEEYMVGVEHDVVMDTLVQVRYVHRTFRDFMAMTDIGLEWAPTELRDPGPDGRVGTADDGGLFTAYRNVNPEGSFLYYTNPTDAFRRYDALQLVASRRWARNWQMQTSYTWSRARGTAGNGDFVNAGLNDTGDLSGTRNPGVFLGPNGRINIDGPARYGTSELKGLGSYRTAVLGGFQMSGIVRRQSGSRWERSITYFDTLIPGNFQTIRAEPRGARETDAVWNLDFRTEKDLPFIRSARLGLAFDVFNATNQGTPLSIDGNSGSSFGGVVSRNDPRLLRLLLRVRF